jgi:hypothetical protein
MTSEPFTGRVLPGERIVWSGQPQQGLLLTERDIFHIPGSLAWCGFAIFWASTATRASLAGPALIGVLFVPLGRMLVVIGLYFVVGRFIVDAWVRRRVYYAVTDQRILIERGAPLWRFTALNIARLPDITLEERSNGRGTIRFEESDRRMRAWSPSLDPTPQLLSIEDARRVFDLIQRSRARASASG